MAVSVEVNEGQEVVVSDRKAASLIEQVASFLENWEFLDNDELHAEISDLERAFKGLIVK